MPQRIECIILGLKPHAENYQMIHLLSSQYGILSGLIRISKKTTNLTPDLFDYGSFEHNTSKSHKSLFLEQYELIERFTAIGKNFHCLNEASFLAKFILENTTHFETHTVVTPLFLRALKHFNQGYSPQLITLKMLYILAREEGLPAKEEWLDQLSKDIKSSVSGILMQNIDVPPDSEALSHARYSFSQWLKKHDFKL